MLWISCCTLALKVDLNFSFIFTFRQKISINQSKFRIGFWIIEVSPFQPFLKEGCKFWKKFLRPFIETFNFFLFLFILFILINSALCFLIAAQTTSGTHREHLCWCLSNTEGLVWLLLLTFLNIVFSVAFKGALLSLRSTTVSGSIPGILCFPQGWV